MKRYQIYNKDIIYLVIFFLLAIDITMNLSIRYTKSALQQDTQCIPIVMYHQVKNSNLGKDVISPYEFEEDLKYLSTNSYTTITMTDLIDYVYEGKELPPKPIIISFDDGYLSTYRYVFPLLKQYNMKIVLSIIGKSIDDFTRVSDININYSHMTWDQVKEMQESGYAEIQNHSYNLHKISNGRYGCCQKTSETMEQYKTILSDDIMKLQDEIESYIGIAPNTFAYPYGRYCNNTDIILKELGFKSSLSVTYGVNLINENSKDDLFGLKRMCRSHNYPINELIKEGLATVRYIS